MGHLLRTAVRRALHRPALAVGLWLITLVASYLASLPADAALHAILDTQPLARPLSLGQADILWAEVLSAHPTLPAAAVASLLGAAALSFLLTAGAAGGLIDALRPPGDPRRVIGRRVLARAAETAPAMLSMAAWGLPLRAAVLLLCLPVALAFGKWAPGRGLRQTGPTLVGLVACALLLWSTASVILHYARVFRLAARPGQRAFSSLHALGGALRHAARHPAPTLTLALFSLLGTAAIAAAGHGLLSLADRAAAPLAVLFLHRQMFSLCRSALSLSVLAGAVSAAASSDDSEGAIRPALPAAGESIPG
jgi:hypothetical protein